MKTESDLERDVGRWYSGPVGWHWMPVQCDDAGGGGPCREREATLLRRGFSNNGQYHERER